MRQYRVLYGHGQRGGKLYTYEGNDGLRIGQQAVAPVTKGNTTYNTMVTIMKTNKADSIYALAEANRLEGRNIAIKRILGTDVINNLPGGAEYRDDPRLRTLQQMKREWTIDSNKRYRAELQLRGAL